MLPPVNIDASRVDVLRMSNRHELRICAITSLDPRGTSVILHNLNDDAVLRKIFDGRILAGPRVVAGQIC